MIYVIDTLSFGAQHEQFNISFLNLLKSSTDEKICFYGTKSGSEHLRKSVPGIDFKSVKSYQDRGGVKEFYRAFDQYKILKNLIRQAEKNQVSCVYILLIHPLAHFLLKNFAGSTQNTRIVLHGELESIKFNKHFVNKIWGVFLKSALTKQIRNIEYIILGGSVYKNLTEVLPSFASQQCIILDHPYPFAAFHNSKNLYSGITFSCLGVASIQKNTHYFFKLAEAVSGDQTHVPVKFNVCGRVFESMTPYLNSYVNHRAVNHSLSRTEVNALLEASHFAVFYYDNANYSLCPSGAFWDAVNAELPLLYVKNDYFEYYAGVVGRIGRSFASPEELNAFVRQLAQNGMPDEEYSRYITNLRSLKYEYMEAARLASQLQGERRIK